MKQLQKRCRGKMRNAEWYEMYLEVQFQIQENIRNSRIMEANQKDSTTMFHIMRYFFSPERIGKKNQTLPKLLFVRPMILIHLA